MAYCSNCGSQIGNGSLFCPCCGSRVGVILNVQRQSLQPFEQQRHKPFKPNSNMAFAIVTTCLCCVPFGIYAIIMANKVDTLYDMGEYEKAEMAANDAKKWSIIGMISGLIVELISIVYLILAFAIGFGDN